MHRCRTFPLLLVQMGYGLLCGLWVWRRRTNRRPCRLSSSSVQSIDLPTDCMAWLFRTMKVPNGCSTPAPKSSAAKQWIKEKLVQTKEEECFKNDFSSQCGKEPVSYFNQSSHIVSDILAGQRAQRPISLPPVTAGPSRCGAQCKTWARDPMQDLGAGPLWTVILWRHRIQSTVLRSW